MRVGEMRCRQSEKNPPEQYSAVYAIPRPSEFDLALL